MQEPKFLICNHCGNVVYKVHDAGVPVMCCGEPMKELVPGSADAAQEKHVPVVQVSQSHITVEVGEAAHPMTEEHWIAWVFLQTLHGGQIAYLLPDQPPKACFTVCHEDEPIAVFAYCNLHGLWKQAL